MTDLMANELLNEWKERLGLQEWVIILKINQKFEDLEQEEAIAETMSISSIKNATIRITDEKLNEGRSIKFDFEKILVHELLHVKFGIIETDVNSYETLVTYKLQHQILDDIANALIMTKRGIIKRSDLYKENEK